MKNSIAPEYTGGFCPRIFAKHADVDPRLIYPHLDEPLRKGITARLTPFLHAKRISRAANGSWFEVEKAVHQFLREHGDDVITPDGKTIKRVLSSPQMHSPFRTLFDVAKLLFNAGTVRRTIEQKRDELNASLLELEAMDFEG